MVVEPFSTSIMSKPITEILLTDDVLDVEEIKNMVSHPRCGAISIFIGTTRDMHGGKVVVKLEYECYKKMAEKKIEKICGDVRERWPDVYSIAVHHRLGIVPVMDASIVIAISSAHRKDAMEASAYFIDTLKATVPIWKKEIYDDGTREWQENKECDWGKT